MTREKALYELNYLDINSGDIYNTESLINIIYDYFEGKIWNNRTCENCKLWQNDELGKWCSKTSGDMEEKDYCSKFERKN